MDQIEPETLKGRKKFLLLIDDYTRRMWVLMLRKKSEAFEVFKKFKILEELEKN